MQASEATPTAHCQRCRFESEMVMLPSPFRPTVRLTRLRFRIIAGAGRVFLVILPVLP